MILRPAVWGSACGTQWTQASSAGRSALDSHSRRKYALWRASGVGRDEASRASGSSAGADSSTEVVVVGPQQGGPSPVWTGH